MFNFFGRSVATKKEIETIDNLSRTIARMAGIQAAHHAVISVLVVRMDDEKRNRLITALKEVLGRPPTTTIEDTSLHPKIYGDALSGTLMAFIEIVEGGTPLGQLP